MKPIRSAWGDLPDAQIHATESSVKQHPDYHAAKSGDADAAARLVADTFSRGQAEELRKIVGSKGATLVSVHAYEADGVNAIPEAFSEALANYLGWNADKGIVQTNVVQHTGADGFSRLARQAAFDGDVQSGGRYVLVDDFIGQGGTLANLKGYIEAKGGHVIAASSLTGKPFSAKLNLSQERLNELREKHGQDLEKWWKKRFGHGFDRLTESEARYLARSPDANAIRNKIAAAEQTGNSGASEGSVSQSSRRNAGNDDPLFHRRHQPVAHPLDSCPA